MSVTVVPESRRLGDVRDVVRGKANTDHVLRAFRQHTGASAKVRRLDHSRRCGLVIRSGNTHNRIVDIFTSILLLQGLLKDSNDVKVLFVKEDAFPL